MADPSGSDLASEVSDFEDRDRSAIRLAALITLTFAASGAIAIPSVQAYGLHSYSLFYEQFARIEPAALAMVALFAFAILILVARTRDGAAISGIKMYAPRPGLWPWGGVCLALGVLLVTLLGTDLIFHRFFLADDEYSAYFQALIFARGRWSAIVSPEWCRWIEYLTPDTIVQPKPCTWHVGYLPVHSMVRAMFIAIGADRFAGPVMAGLSTLLVGATARRLWSDRPDRTWIAMAALATSTQFLVMSMTMYAMPTHLLFATMWVWLYVVDRTWSVALLPIVGVVALGVHSPIPHGLLVPVFWLRYVRQKRFATACYIAAVYAIGIVYWHTQLTSGATVPSVAAQSSAAATTVVSMFHLPSPLDLYTSAMNAALIATWNSPVFLVCVLAAGLTWHRLDTFSRDAVLTLLFVVLARMFSNSLQGEGWGYRFIYAGLGLFALVAACGCDVLARVVGNRSARALVVTSILVSVAVELPMRGVQIGSIIGPYYRAWELLSHQTAKIVVFRSDAFMWARQLVRNDPFLQQPPLIMSMHLPGEQALPRICVQPAEATVQGPTVATAQGVQRERFCAAIQARLSAQEAAFAALVRAYPGQVRAVTSAELAAVGLPPLPFGGVRLEPTASPP